MERGHAEALAPMVVGMMDQAGIGFPELDAVVVTVGPGSFTGLRVGLATAKGFALALALPVIGVTTLETVAFGASVRNAAAASGSILAAIETKRADIYAQLFAADATALSEPMAVLPDGLASIVPPGPVFVAGDAASRAIAALAAGDRRAVAVPGMDVPDAADAGRLAARRVMSDGVPQPDDRPAPLYIHPPRARLPAGGGRLRP